MTRVLTLSVDQLYRRQPGGIGTYVNGLVQGLLDVAPSDLTVVGLAPRGPRPPEARALSLEVASAGLPLALLIRAWPWWPVGVPRAAQIVHATSMAGPFGGGTAGAVHSVALHDLLWRDEPGATTPSGVRFHERRLQLLARREHIRLFLTSPDLVERLAAEGFARSRLHQVRLGSDDDALVPAREREVRELLGAHGVTGPFTLYAGTREPRKNIERLIEAHSLARLEQPELGPLVIVGPSGWGHVATWDAVILGRVKRAMLKGLFRDAAVVAYVPLSEGWGLPPVEALHVGARVVASSTTPSMRANDEVVLVDPYCVTSIGEGLVAAAQLGHDEASADRRRRSVADLTWRNAALDHLRGWQ